MVDRDLFLEVHNMDKESKDSSLEEENFQRNMINRKPQQRTYLISHVASDIGVGIVIRRRELVKKLRR